MAIVELLLQNVRVRVCHLQREEQEATRRLLSYSLMAEEEKTLHASHELSHSQERDIATSGKYHFSGLCIQDECDDIIAEYNAKHDVKPEDMVSAVSTIDKEFKDVMRMLVKRHAILVQNVQQVARDKIVKLHQQAHMLHEMHTVMFVLIHDHNVQLQKGQEQQQLQEVTSGDQASARRVEQLVEWTDHSIRKSEALVQMDILDEVRFNAINCG